MTEVLGQAVLELATDSSKLDSELKNIGSRLTGTGAAITGLTAPIAGIGTAALKMGADFNHSLDLIVGLVGISREQVNAWKDDLYELGKETAKSPQELAEALYFVTSSGVEASQAMDVLRAAAQASAAGLGDTASVADAVTSAMNAYGAENLSAAQATSVLVAMVREGKGEAAEFAPVLGHVIPIAAQLGVTFEQVGGAMAYFTRFGLPAAEAATALRQILQSMVRPTRMESEELAKMGLSFGELTATLREKGLLATLQMLDERLGGNTEAMARIFPRVDGLSGIMAILGENAGMAEQVFASLANTTEADLGAAFGAIAEGPGFKMKQSMNELRVELVQLGDILLPLVADIIVPGLGKASEAVGGLVAAFDKLPEPIQKVIVVAAALAVGIGPLLVTVGLAVTAFGMLQMAAPGAAAAMVGFSTGLLSIAAPAAAVMALAMILGTDMKELAVVVGLATAAFLLFRSAAVVSVFTGLISGVTATIGVFISLAATEGVAASATFALSTAFTALRAVLFTLPGALAAIAIGFIALDAIAKVALGKGLIDMFTGAGTAAKAAERYVRDFGSAAEYVKVAMEGGATSVEANAAALEHYAGLLQGAIRQAERMRQEGVDDFDQWIKVSEAIKGHKEQVLALVPTYEDLKALLEKYPGLLKELGGDLEELRVQWEAVQWDRAKQQVADVIVALSGLMGATTDTGDAAAAGLDSYLKSLEVTGEAVDNLATVVLTKLGNSLEHLELEKRANELEAFGDAAPEGELEAVNTQLQAMNRYNEEVTLGIKILGERLRIAAEQAGETFDPSLINNFAQAIIDLPRDIVMQILPLLDALSASQVVRFMQALEAGVTVPVAFLVGKFGVPAAFGALPGVSAMMEQLGRLAMSTVPAAKSIDFFRGAVAAAGGAAGSAAEKELTLADAVSDGVADRTEAEKLGLSASQAATEELTVARQKEADEVWRAQVELAKLTIALGEGGVTGAAFGFAVAVGIARGELTDTGLALEKFMQDDVISYAEAIEGKLNPAQAAALELTRARAVAEQEAAAKAYDDQKALQGLALVLGDGATAVRMATQGVAVDLGELVRFLSRSLMGLWDTGTISQKVYDFGVTITTSLSDALAEGGGALRERVAALTAGLVEAWETGEIDQASYDMGMSIVNAVAQGLASGTEVIAAGTEQALGPSTLQMMAFWAAAKIANEGTLTLTDALNLGMTPAQAATIQSLADVVKKHEELQAAIFNLMIEMGTFSAQLLGLPTPIADSVRELDNLGRRLGVEGLGQQVLDFELALQAVNTSFGDARSAAADFAYGIGVELVGQLQSALGQLLGGPTQETAQLQLDIDTLRYQLAVQEAAGATEEQTQAIRDQIAALEAQLGVYTADHRVMQDRAVLADQTLPTERELKDMVATITENIGIYSGKVDDLSWATDIQTLATANAVAQTDRLGLTTAGATDYLSFFTRSLGDSAGTVTDSNYALAGAADYAKGLMWGLGDAGGYAGPKTWGLGDAAAYAAGVLNSITPPAGMQSGGLASGLTMVGERGRELIWAPPRTRVFAHDETERLMAGLGTPTGPLAAPAVQLHIEHLHLPNVQDPATFVREIVRQAGKLQERASRGV